MDLQACFLAQADVIANVCFGMWIQLVDSTKLITLSQEFI